MDQRREVSTATEADTTRGTDTAARPYAFYVVAIALVLVSITFVVTMLIFSRRFEQAAEVTSALSSLFTVVGTVIGAYFGIKVAGDTTDKSRGVIERANETANRALAALPPQEGKQVMERPARQSPQQPSGSLGT